MHLKKIPCLQDEIFNGADREGTPKNSWRGVPPGSLNPDPISDQKCHFPHPLSVAFKIHTGFRPGL